ncbi:MAG: hypothetical protein DRP11_01360 [Candidatus Aenigmatarchaeota archaeon]|nr:MAG: hypothetical protein DRP11_01360 [Candidatus Aenigmarchaeota archaeon]
MAYLGGMENIFGREFFSVVLPWLFTFAVVYGVLEHLNLPQNKPARAITGIVIAFIVGPALAPYVGVLMGMASGFVILISGLLVLIILLEILGVRAKGKIIVENEKGEKREEEAMISIFEAHPKFFAIVLGILAILVFIGVGGPQAMGVSLPSSVALNWPLLFFLGVMVLIVYWMVSES